MEHNLEKINDSFIRHINFQTPNFSEKYLGDNMHQKQIVNKQIGISIIIICKNEERCIGRCLKNIQKQICMEDEIIVIDTGSTDQTKKIVKESVSVAKIKEVSWIDDFAYVRNIGIDIAVNNWLFFIDADEYLEKGSLENLRTIFSIAETFENQDFVICPTIINSNGKIINGVRRILNKKSGLRFWGFVHEEIRCKKENLGCDVEAVAFDNVILFHDGYEREVIKSKDKLHRNKRLLLKMIECEPKHPRWIYFLARDAKDELTEIEYEKLLIETVKLCDEKKIFEYYDIRALSDLTNFYISKGCLDKAEKVLENLKNRIPNLSDVFYFSTYIDFCKLKGQILTLLIEACKFRETCTEVEFGSIHSNYFHIDFLIAKLFFEVGEYEKSFSILKKLKFVKYYEDDKYYLGLLEAIKKYLET